MRGSTAMRGRIALAASRPQGARSCDVVDEECLALGLSSYLRTASASQAPHGDEEADQDESAGAGVADVGGEAARLVAVAREDLLQFDGRAGGPAVPTPGDDFLADELLSSQQAEQGGQEWQRLAVDEGHEDGLV